MPQQEFRPPLPRGVLDVLARASLCYLGTAEACADGGAAPHLSLMSFTFVDDAALGPVLVMSTRRDTRKFAALVANPKVAVLAHDFDGLQRRSGAGAGSGATAGSSAAAAAGAGDAGPAACSGGTLSVTTYGLAHVAEGATAERLRAAHLAANAGYGQFIAGEGIAVIYVVPRMVRMCTLRDEVTSFSVPLGPGQAEAGAASGGAGEGGRRQSRGLSWGSLSDGGGGCSGPGSPAAAVGGGGAESAADGSGSGGGSSAALDGSSARSQ